MKTKLFTFKSIIGLLASLLLTSNTVLAEGGASGNGEGDGAFATPLQTNGLLKPHEKMRQMFKEASGRKTPLSFSGERCPEKLAAWDVECADFIPFNLVKGDLNFHSPGVLWPHNEAYNNSRFEFNLTNEAYLTSSKNSLPLLAVRKVNDMGEAGTYTEIQLVSLDSSRNFPIIGTVVETPSGYQVLDNLGNKFIEFRQYSKATLIYEISPTQTTDGLSCASLDRVTRSPAHPTEGLCAVGQYWTKK